MTNTTKHVRDLKYKTHFCHWLAGLIDGDGYLGVSKKGYTSCEISVGLVELSLLNRIKDELGSSTSLRKDVKGYRWRLHNREGI